MLYSKTLIHGMSFDNLVANRKLINHSGEWHLACMVYMKTVLKDDFQRGEIRGDDGDEVI